MSNGKTNIWGKPKRREVMKFINLPYRSDVDPIRKKYIPNIEKSYGKEYIHKVIEAPRGEMYKVWYKPFTPKITTTKTKIISKKRFGGIPSEGRGKEGYRRGDIKTKMIEKEYSKDTGKLLRRKVTKEVKGKFESNRGDLITDFKKYKSKLKYNTPVGKYKDKWKSKSYRNPKRAMEVGYLGGTGKKKEFNVKREDGKIISRMREKHIDTLQQERWGLWKGQKRGIQKRFRYFI
jgi:hypothetical protein